MELNQEIVRELLDYDPESGLLTWKQRDCTWFKPGNKSSISNCLGWNKKYANTEIKYKDKKGYLYARILSKSFLAHRVIWLWMNGEWPNQIDHINGIKDDNRWINLREVDNQENSKNRSIGTNNTSGTIGISWHKIANKWRVEINDNKKYVYVGLYNTKEEAIFARKLIEQEYNYHKNHGRKND